MIRRIPIHPAQTAELILRKNAADQAQAHFADAAKVIVLGAGILEGELQAIDTDTNELVVDVMDASALELELEPKLEGRG